MWLGISERYVYNKYEALLIIVDFQICGQRWKLVRNIKSEFRCCKVLFTGEIPCILVLKQWTIRKKQTFEPRFNIVSLDMGDLKYNYSNL